MHSDFGHEQCKNVDFFSMGRLTPSCHPGDTAQEFWPYYHRAIMESGTGSFWSYITLDAAKGNWQQVLNATKCSSEAENRRLSDFRRFFGIQHDPTPTGPTGPTGPSGGKVSKIRKNRNYNLSSSNIIYLY